jgi:hypothetical protein
MRWRPAIEKYKNRQLLIEPVVQNWQDSNCVRIATQ